MARGPVDLSQVKPLPVWFFTSEGVLGAAYDLSRVWGPPWLVLAVLVGGNMASGLTVLGRRRKLLRGMLRSRRTRAITIGLIALRVGAHVALGAAGTQVTSAAGHLAFAVGMAGATVGLLWFDQRVTFRALGLTVGGAA